MSEELSSIVYIGHLPQDFEEKELKNYFKQFGDIKNLQLSRSKKTGNSKHYGWIEFETPEIASVVAKTMNNYLFFNSLLVCNVLPVSKVHPMLFKNARRGPKKQKPPTVLTKKEMALRLARQEKIIKAKLDSKGIKYDWPSFIAQFEKAGVEIPDVIDTNEEKETSKE
ncbi:MKI67 FHA domain-interacting nucleolar phosphoprotein [Histomonas meleagridis]|uniref:MKI67 FHA domain-interacting nucleolar phosphoprotein n=1 Tax=Histomonas meleagridis TaxID=135588 RepID=UPI00355A7525|nr:MKI67 FHA domain-interacting nucleolar phosphoprotein [Histomonas meleagridis]KAH0798563.1 MKI67 FHA domain-interacting nucleolar phosphoprotein [Histomonas meleagridis]